MCRLMACRSSNLVIQNVNATRLMKSMPVSRTHGANKMLIKIQSVLEGLHSGKYTDIKEAAKEEGVSAHFCSGCISLRFSR